MNEEVLPTVIQVARRLGAGGSDQYYADLLGNDFAPGWARPAPSIWAAPKNNFKVAVWRYQDARKALSEAGEFVPMELTERRNVLMVNPVAGNIYGSTRNIVAAYQMIKGGEVADDHRHTPHAIRLILDGDAGVFTIVNGKRVEMLPGDLVLTPGMHWHSHANESSAPAYWIDFLDVPLVQHLEGMFFEQSEGDLPEADAPHMAPISSLRFASLEIVEKSGLLNGTKPGVVVLETASIPTMKMSYVALPAQTTMEPIQEVANNLYAVISGTVRVRYGDDVLEAGRGDVVAVPLWKEHTLEADEDTILLNVSDVPVHKALGYYRSAQASA